MTEAELIKMGYTIRNARIKRVDLRMGDHGCFTLDIGLEGSGWSCFYGDICLRHGYLGAEKFDGNPKSVEYIMRIMDVVGVETFSELNGKIVRVALGDIGDPVNIIGNVFEDKWFDKAAFFSEGK